MKTTRLQFSSNALVSWAIVLFLVAIMARVFLWIAYQPIPYSDTPSYRRLAGTVLEGFDHYDGTRTPGYPIFLALVGPDERVWLAQMLLGLANTFLIFFLGWQITHKAWFAGLAGLAHTLNLGQLFFEANLLTETLTTFWLLLTTAGVLYLLLNPGYRSTWLAAGLGLTTSLAMITRPLFLYLPFWVFLFAVYPFDDQEISRKLKRQTLIQGITYLAPVFVIVGGWILFIHNRYGDWSLTTMNGYHLVQHTGIFFEYVPDQYADLRDTYIAFREAHIAQYGTQTNTIWEAIPELQKASGLSFYDLSRTLARISIGLIQEYPHLYLKNVIKGWWLFWRAPVYWSPESLTWPELIPYLRSLIFVERIGLFGINLLFLSSLLPLVKYLAAILPQRRRNSGSQCTSTRARSFIFGYLPGTIWAASIIQTLLDHGDNPRFLVPLQSLVVLWVLWAAWTLLQNWNFGERRERSATTSPGGQT
jgi:hypothetical protein